MIVFRSLVSLNNVHRLEAYRRVPTFQVAVDRFASALHYPKISAALQTEFSLRFEVIPFLHWFVMRLFDTKLCL